jgi:hypothetical protein
MRRRANRGTRRGTGDGTRRGAGLLVPALLLALTGAACTADTGDTGDTGDSDTPAPTQSAVAMRPLAVSTPVTRVAGRLSDADRLALRREVEALLRRYAEKSLLAPGTRAGTALPGFTAGAERRARAQRAVLWGVAGRRAEVRPRRMQGTVSAFAPNGKAQGATLDLDLALDVTRGERTRRVRLTGRMLLTPAGDSWRVFGFDVRRSDR